MSRKTLLSYSTHHQTETETEAQNKYIWSPKRLTPSPGVARLPNRLYCRCAKERKGELFECEGDQYFTHTGNKEMLYQLIFIIYVFYIYWHLNWLFDFRKLQLMENWNMPQPLWGVGLLFYLCYVLPTVMLLQLWVISDLSQIWVYGFRGLRRCQWRGGPEGNLWMSGDRKYPKLFRLSELFLCRVTKIILNYSDYLNI